MTRSSSLPAVFRSTRTQQVPISARGARRVRRSVRTTRLGQAEQAGPGPATAAVELTDDDVAAFLGLSTELFAEFGLMTVSCGAIRLPP